MFLDTTSEVTIYNSLIEILEMSKEEINSFSRKISIDYNLSDLPERQIFNNIKDKIKKHVDVSLFHATRSTNPDNFFKVGILNLDDALTSIFDDVKRFLDKPFSSYENDELHEYCLENNGMYAHRMNSKNYGPFAFLFREAIINSKKLGYHDYLACPEIIENIFDAVDNSGKAKQKYLTASYPTVIKFVLRANSERYVGNALRYLKNKLENKDPLKANTFYDACGKSITSDMILNVEKIEI